MVHNYVSDQRHYLLKADIRAKIIWRPCGSAAAKKAGPGCRDTLVPLALFMAPGPAVFRVNTLPPGAKPGQFCI